jgi:hypothetical protein
MTDATNTDETFDPTDVEATRGREQGLGTGERELNQQGDVGNTVAAPEEDRDFQSASQDSDDDSDDILDENTSVLGSADEDLGEDDTGYSSDDGELEDVTDDEAVEEDEV